MQSDFNAAFEALMGNEGKFSDNPADPGGATMWGITERVARKIGYTGDMRDFPQDTAKLIAAAEYWKPVHGDELPNELAFQVFDACYNSGPARAIEWLQRAAKVTIDGQMGPATIAAIAAADENKIIMRFDAYRLMFLGNLPTWPTFGHGWANRIANNLIRAAG